MDRATRGIVSQADSAYIRVDTVSCAFASPHARSLARTSSYTREPAREKVEIAHPLFIVTERINTATGI
jgi:hypothetical protein